MKYEEHNEMHERLVSHYLYNYYLIHGKIDEAYLESQNFSLIKDKTKMVQIEHYFKGKNKFKKYAVDTYKLQRILLINNDRFKLILQNKNKAKYPLKRIIVFTIVFLLIIILYFWVIQSLKPLSELKNKIKTFSEGNLDIECASDKKDEIAEVANEFDHAVTMIRELLQARQLFLRAIMHELKTPIAKGRLISEMLPDEKNKVRMHSIFERLNLLIDEFAKIEKITSKNFELTIKPYKMSDLIEASIDMLMIEDPKHLITTEIKQDYILEVDFELFTLIIKNLLDNGIKYTTDKHITVVINNNKLEIINHGKALQEPLENYFKPFHTSKKGLGLGLYIVKSILDIHKMKLGYQHKDNKNIFTILS
jgi:two-component system OmpR family sensor kinase